MIKPIEIITEDVVINKGWFCFTEADGTTWEGKHSGCTVTGFQQLIVGKVRTGVEAFIDTNVYITRVLATGQTKIRAL